MNLLSDIITYVRRIIKSPSDATISDNLIIDYINRFWLYDVDARMQLFDLKTTYQFQTVPGVDQYNMPLYNVQIEGTGGTEIAMYPVYQGFLPYARIGGVGVGFYTQRGEFFKFWDNYIQPYETVGIGNGGSNYTVQIPFAPGVQQTVNQIPSGILRGHVDITGIIATGNNIDPPIGQNLDLSIPSTSIYPAVYFTSIDATGQSRVVQDSGQFLTNNVNYGLMMAAGTAPFGYQELDGSQQADGQIYTTAINTINYNTGIANITFTDPITGLAVNIPSGQQINAQCYFYNPGIPRAVLFYNNVLTLRTVPDTQYLVELEAYLSPAAFLSTGQAIQFAYMCEYIARGAARKILSDTGDSEQFAFYEPLFKEQELLVWKRSQRQFTSTRTYTIYAQGSNQGGIGNNTSIGMS